MIKAVPVWNDAEQRWRFSPQHNGQRRTFYSPKAGRAGSLECKRKAAEWIESGKQKDRRLKDVWPEYLEDQTHRGGTSNRKQHASHGATYFIPALGHKLVKAISDQDWQNVINAASIKGVSGHPLSKVSLRNLRATVSSFCHYARKAGLTDARPEIDIPKHALKVTRHIIQPADLSKLFVDAPKWYLNAWRLMVVGGYRPGEVFGLHRDDVAGDHIVIRRSINILGEITEGKNDNAQRTQRQHSFTRKIIADQIKQLNTAGIASVWLFPGRDGDFGKYAASASAWRKYKAQAGINCSLYELRHTFVSIMKNSLPEELLKRIVGHSANMDTFGVYGHEIDGELDEAAALIEQRLTTLIDYTLLGNDNKIVPLKKANC